MLFEHYPYISLREKGDENQSNYHQRKKCLIFHQFSELIIQEFRNSGSQQLHLPHRNEEPTWPKLPIRIPKYKNQFCCCYRRVFTAHTTLHYLRGTAGRGGPRLGTDKGLIQFFLQPSWQHFSSASQLASSKHSSSWPSQHTRGSTEGQKPGLSVMKKECEK